MYALAFISVVAAPQLPQHTLPPTPAEAKSVIGISAPCKPAPAGGSPADARKRPQSGSNANAAAYAARIAGALAPCQKASK